MRHLLQVANVGRITGGTAACAWTVMRCFPDCRHTVVFLSRVSAEARAAFAGVRVLQWNGITPARVEDTGADVVLLHNTSAGRVDAPLPAPTLQYLHSRITPAAADRTIVCSHWLAGRMRMPGECVVHQAVPRPALPFGWGETRALRRHPVIGRLCTPQRKKWPAEVVPFYRDLARQFREVQWEFVGCPGEMRRPLFDSCDGRAMFFKPSWHIRQRLWHWDALLYHNPHVTESFGRTVAEAMRAGCIPIVDNRGGFREQMNDECGCLCEDASDFAAAVAAIHLPRLRIEMSSRCREHADREFSLRRFRERLLAVLGGIGRIGNETGCQGGMGTV